MPEVPWFSDPPDARLSWSIENEWGHLAFYDPNGEYAVIPVTPGNSDAQTALKGTNIWHIEVNGDMVTVSPSVHFIDRWHSPNPVSFHLVEELPERE